MAMSSGGGNDNEPMMDMNTTPLIDVMLVLLVMLIITIPIQTHAVKIDLPRDTKTPPPPVKPDVNTLGIAATNQIYWNNNEVDYPTLIADLAIMQKMSPEPELHIQPDPQAPFSTVDQVLALVKRSKVSKIGFVGNEQYAYFTK